MGAAETLRRLLNADWSGREPMFCFGKISEFLRLDIRKEAVQMPRKKLLRGKNGGRNDALLVRGKAKITSDELL